MENRELELESGMSFHQFVTAVWGKKPTVSPSLLTVDSTNQSQSCLVALKCN